MPIFNIDTVVTSVSQDSRDGCIAITRILEAEGPAEDGGRNRARFVFSPEIGRGHPTPVGYLTRDGESGLSLIGWLPAGEYEAHRSVVAGGGRLQVHYETRDGGLGYLRRLALGRADAPLVAVASSSRRGRIVGRQAFAMPL